MARFPLNPPFDLNEFVRRLIAETFFYDDDAGIIGSLSLIDEMTGRECFIASFMPEEGSFIIEECTEWEEEEENGDEEQGLIGYALATDSQEYASFESPEEAADALMELAVGHSLSPAINVLLEEEEIS